MRSGINFRSGMVIKTKHSDYYIIRYIDESWWIRHNGILVPIQVPDIFEATILYSLPSNPVYPHWTEKKVKKGQISHLAPKWWSPIYDGMKVKGYIKDKVFVITSKVK